jgi:hypothetical protein
LIRGDGAVADRKCWNEMVIHKCLMGAVRRAQN